VRERELEILLRGRRSTAGWVVKKDSCRTVSKCRVLSGSIGTSGWSIGYSLGTRLDRTLKPKPHLSATQKPSRSRRLSENWPLTSGSIAPPPGRHKCWFSTAPVCQSCAAFDVKGWRGYDCHLQRDRYGHTSRAGSQSLEYKIGTTWAFRTFFQ